MRNQDVFQMLLHLAKKKYIKLDSFFNSHSENT